MNQKDPINENALKDPVCGMNITQDSTYHHEYEAQKYYFCSQKGFVAQTYL